MNRLLVLETNEIPRRVLEWYAETNPTSAIAGVLRDGAVGETVNTDDVGDRELYPSQTWATLAMGVPLAKHGVYWYADPKPQEFPLYWQLAARHRSVGVVGSLHSSPLAASTKLPGLRFCVPDVFAPDADTLPTSLRPLQEFSLAMTNANSRAVTSRSPLASYGRGLLATLGARVRPTTYALLARTAAGVAAGRIPKERLRTAHFDLMADVFERLMRDHDPDLGVFFTNHVAAAMHRYWYASFPHDWEEEQYGPEWRERFEHEIPAALDALDRVVDRLLAFCESTDRGLVMVSSMGQSGGAPLADDRPDVFVVRDARLFLEAIGIESDFEVRAAMVPQISAEFDSVEMALVERDRLERRHHESSVLAIDQSGQVLTVTYDLDVASAGRVMFDGEPVSAESLGGRIVAVEEHRNGLHDPHGVIAVANSASAALPTTHVDACDVAPAILEYLGVSPAPHHRDPGFSL